MDAQTMTYFLPTGPDLFAHLLSTGIWLGVGAFIGATHFLTLRWNVRMLADDRPLPLGLATQLARFMLTAGVLAIVAGYFGVFPLLVATAGILVARTAILRYG
jgi:F1F0 ATPase subunit 2